MARTVRDPKLDTRSARTKLAPRREPYWAKLGPGLHVGYRRVGREGGTWVARAYDAEARRRAYQALGAADDVLDSGSGILTFAEAQERARAWFPRAFLAADASAQDGAPAPRTVGDAVRSYLEWLDAQGKPSTARAARHAAEIHILPHLGSIRLDRLTSGRIEQWFHGLAKAPRRVRGRKDAPEPSTRPIVDDDDARRASRATANRIRTYLVAALNRAFHAGHIGSDQAWRRVKPFRGADAARLRWLTLDEATRLLNACSPDFRRLVRGALLTGCRYGELTRLLVQDIDLDGGSVHVRESKSGRPRHVPLDADGLAFFHGLVAGRPPREVLFVRDDGQPWGRSWQLRPMAEASAAARLEPPASFHTLRHTYASHRVMAGAPLIVIATALGHADTRMVEKHYGHLAPSYVRDVIRATPLGLGAGDDVQVAPLQAARSVTKLASPTMQRIPVRARSA